MNCILVGAPFRQDFGRMLLGYNSFYSNSLRITFFFLFNS